MEDRRASLVATYHEAPENPPLDENPDLASWAVDAMIHWNDVLRPVVLDLEPES